MTLDQCSPLGGILIQLKGQSEENAMDDGVVYQYYCKSPLSKGGDFALEQISQYMKMIFFRKIFFSI